jgi:hypothetical protein
MTAPVITVRLRDQPRMGRLVVHLAAAGPITVPSPAIHTGGRLASSCAGGHRTPPPCRCPMASPAGRASRRQRRKLWHDVLAEFDLTGADLVLLAEAARTADRIAALEAAAGDRLTIPGASGGRVIAPEIREARQQTIMLARLLAAQRVVAGEDEKPGQQRQGFRGMYQVHPGDAG